MIHLDTTILIDLLREAGKTGRGPATAFLHSVSDEDLWISVFVACELFAGAELSSRPKRERKRVTALVDSLHVAYPDSRFAAQYAGLLAGQQKSGRSLATMDLLIATSAILADSPLATRNLKHFSRLPGLEVISY